MLHNLCSIIYAAYITLIFFDLKKFEFSALCRIQCNESELLCFETLKFRHYQAWHMLRNTVFAEIDEELKLRESLVR